jgi:hypothetical protein
VTSWMDPTAMQIGPRLAIHTQADVDVAVIIRLAQLGPNLNGDIFRKTAVDPLPEIERVSAWARLGDLDI